MEDPYLTTIAPFWRGPVHINAEEYRAIRESVLTVQKYPEARRDELRKICELLPTMSASVRDNVQRILAAALLAENWEGRIQLVEGCRANAIDVPTADHRTLRLHRTGSEVGVLILRLLQTFDVVPGDLDCTIARESRCTDWEAETLLRRTPPDADFIGVAGVHSEPSCKRANLILGKLARRWLNRENSDANAYSTHAEGYDWKQYGFSEDQQVVFNAAALTGAECEESKARERKNWMLQRFSDAFNRFGLRGKWSAIAWMARLLPSRWDKPRRQLIS